MQMPLQMAPTTIALLQANVVLFVLQQAHPVEVEFGMGQILVQWVKVTKASMKAEKMEMRKKNGT